MKHHEAGDEFFVVADERKAKEIAALQRQDHARQERMLSAAGCQVREYVF